MFQQQEKNITEMESLSFPHNSFLIKMSPRLQSIVTLKRGKARNFRFSEKTKGYLENAAFLFPNIFAFVLNN